MSKTHHHQEVLRGFNLIAPTIWEYIPFESSPPPSSPSTLSSDSDTPPPDVILLFPWTGALARHIQKYTTTYQQLFPKTPILVITTSIKDLIIRSSSQKQCRLQPAINRLTRYPSTSNILIHAFSEGGANKCVEFAESYFHLTGTRLPCSALCLDSTPGHPRYLRLCNALKKSLPPHPILRCSGLVIGGAVLGGFWIVYGIFRGPKNNIISKTRRRLVDAEVWNLDNPRCYLYSKGDELIAWKDIQEHAREAVELDIPVVDVCFQDSDHCKHAAEDVDKYWDAVVLTWKRAMSPAEKGHGEVVARWAELKEMKVEITPVLTDADSEKTLAI